ncbi:MAG: hypothetical protein K6T86_08205 [Pirellulales bacterium]|jgi:hypothetical protein|nr:hypothetical protein [Pirellulales bacterium]
MPEALKPPQEAVLTKLLRLNAALYGLVAGLAAGSGLAAATLWLVIKGGVQVGKHLQLLHHYCPGYTVTAGGALVGFAYGFGYGFAAGYLVARIYNLVVDWRERRKPAR